MHVDYARFGKESGVGVGLEMKLIYKLEKLVKILLTLSYLLSLNISFKYWKHLV